MNSNLFALITHYSLISAYCLISNIHTFSPIEPSVLTMEEYSSDDSVDCSGRVPAENFRGDKHLECISLDPSCNYIMYGTFLYCVSLITMKLSSGIESIEDDAFFGCSSLDTLQIPITVQRIGTRLFKKCCSLRILYYPAIKQSPRYDELIDSNTNVIILRSEVCPRHSIDDELNKHTVISFEQLVRCIDILPNNLFNESDLHVLYNGLNLYNEEMARKARSSKLTILTLPCSYFLFRNTSRVSACSHLFGKDLLASSAAALNFFARSFSV